MSPGKLPTVSFTLLSVSSPLAIMSLFSVSVALLPRHFNTFSLHAPWPSVLSWLPHLLCVHLSCAIMSSLASIWMNYIVSQGFLFISLMSVNSTSGTLVMIFGFATSLRAQSISLRVSVLWFVLTFLCSSIVSILPVIVVFSFVSGVPGVSLPPSRKTAYFFTSSFCSLRTSLSPYGFLFLLVVTVANLKYNHICSVPALRLD